MKFSSPVKDKFLREFQLLKYILTFANILKTLFSLLFPKKLLLCIFSHPEAIFRCAKIKKVFSLLAVILFKIQRYRKSSSYFLEKLKYPVISKAANKWKPYKLEFSFQNLRNELPTFNFGITWTLEISPIQSWNRM